MRAIIIFLLVFLYGLSFAQSKQGTITPLVLGEQYEIQSTQLSEKRTLNIYLPPGYKDGDTVKYPVIYLLDGGMDEDFIHIVGLVQFNSFPWVAWMPESIVVGITNADRKRDFTYPTTVKSDKDKYPTTGGSAKFIAFIEKELQPYINKKFRTNNSKTIIGESLGGLLATEILFTKPYLFNKYIIISPSLWWDNGSLLKKPIDDKHVHENTGIYVGVGKEGLAPTAEPHVMEVDVNMLVEKIENLHNKNISVYFDYLPDETHATICHQAVFDAFRKLYQPPK
jgi:predicted alpha/beta superfamily hydrolase